MFLQRFYHDGLAQASYMIACQTTAQALVVDANRNLEPYLAAAAAHRFRITHVSETHIHADYVSGSRDLAKRTGARLLLSGEGGHDWQYAFAKEDGATLLHDGDTFRLGNVEIRAVHTPGHTPEHLTFIVTDTEASAQPMGALTGDFIFVGDVGRPDLLERAAGIVGTMRDSARQLFASLQSFASAYPDHLQIWPGHGAGSACGKALGAVPTSTLGYEKLANWAFQAGDVDAFVKEVLESQSEPPPYFARMKHVNRDGAASIAAFSQPSRQPANALPELLTRGALVVDLRPTAAFARGGVPGTLNLPLNNSFVSRAGWLLPYEGDIYLLSGDESETTAHAAVSELQLIGIENVRGWFGPDALQNSARPADQKVAQVTATEAARRVQAGNAVIIDVRNADEWRMGHISGARHIPLGKIAAHAQELPRDRQVVLQCASGGRSGIAASILLKQGVTNVANLEGGYNGWHEAGLPITLDGDS